jgi:hypothetical protein
LAIVSRTVSKFLATRSNSPRHQSTHLSQCHPTTTHNLITIHSAYLDINQLTVPNTVPISIRNIITVHISSTSLDSALASLLVYSSNYSHARLWSIQSIVGDWSDFSIGIDEFSVE